MPSSNMFFEVGFVVAERNLFMPLLGYLLFFAYSYQLCLTTYENSKVSEIVFEILIVTLNPFTDIPLRSSFFGFGKCFAIDKR